MELECWNVEISNLIDILRVFSFVTLKAIELCDRIASRVRLLLTYIKLKILESIDLYLHIYEIIGNCNGRNKSFDSLPRHNLNK